MNKHNVVDLHIHTNYSDGEHTLKEVLDFINEKGIKYFSITDHDRLQKSESLTAINNFCKKENIKFIEGVEVSSIMNFKGIKKSVHILGYGIINKKELNEYLKNALRIRAKRNYKMLDKFNKFFKSNGFDIQKIIKKNKDFQRLDVSDLARPHFAKLLVYAGICKNFDSAFRDYLTEGKPLFIPKENISTFDVISILNKTCKFSIVAHFGESFRNFSFSEKMEILNILKNYNIKGFEVFYSRHSCEDEKLLFDFVLKNNLIFTAGSDFHGKTIRDVEIGQISENFTPFYQKQIIKRMFNS